MADTTEFEIIQNDWIELTQFGNCGFFTNSGGQSCLCTEAKIKPDANSVVGHPVFPGNFLDFNAKDGQKIWIKSIRGDGIITVTPA